MVSDEQRSMALNDTHLRLVRASGCGDAARLRRRREPAGRGRGAPAPRDAERGRIVFLGTSLTAGLGRGSGQAYPALIQPKMDSARLALRGRQRGCERRDLGRSTCGASTGCCASRCRSWWSRPAPTTDCAGSTPTPCGPTSRRSSTGRSSSRRSRRIVLAGMRALPNYGLGYARRFRAVYADLRRGKRPAARSVPASGCGGSG